MRDARPFFALATALALHGCSAAETSDLDEGLPSPGAGEALVDAGPASATDGGSSLSDGGAATADAGSAAPDAGAIPCGDRTEATCGDDPACAPFVCSGCFGNDQFICYEVAVGPPPCPRPDCRCENLDEITCGYASICHGVYVERPELCDCDAPGCCMVFERCTAPGFANCGFQEALCQLPAPTCGPGFSISYRDSCYEGCARNEDCVN